MTKFFQKQIRLVPYPRGFHLITRTVTEQFPEIEKIDTGVLQIFIKHTSASLSISENADPSVRTDLEKHFNVLAPEDQPYYQHTLEGSDDMPAHIKNALLGSSLQIPITGGKLNMGIWQGIYLCEHRDYGGSRNLVLTAFGN
ncbi:MAG: YjbQ family protein [Flavobacteriia bacterium]|nr:MAG: YjbQ family protein [Flavobacteriia bacterium]